MVILTEEIIYFVNGFWLFDNKLLTPGLVTKLKRNVTSCNFHFECKILLGGGGPTSRLFSHCEKERLSLLTTFGPRKLELPPGEVLVKLHP